MEKKKVEGKLNIYGQNIWYDEVLILGTEESLRGLVEIIEGVLENKEVGNTFKASDGLKYDVVVRVKEDEADSWGDVELPYRELMARDNGWRVTKEMLVSGEEEKEDK